MNDRIDDESGRTKRTARSDGDDALSAEDAAGAALVELYRILITLRSPDGCPWDREQTASSLRKHLIEETYELVDAIDSGSVADVQEELGDVLLLVTMVARCYEEAGAFSFATVVDTLNEKLVRRHPHVFGDATAADSEAVVKQWNEIKEQMEGKPKKTRVLDAVSRSAPPLDRAYRLQKKAAKSGFDWTSAIEVLAKLREEIQEVEEVLQSSEKDTRADALESEVGDLLFSAVNVSRYVGVDPSIALNRTNGTFYTRFAYVEDQMRRAGLAMTGDEIERMEDYWQEAKNQ